LESAVSITTLERQDNYTIRRYGLVAPNLGKSTRKYVRKAGPAGEFVADQSLRCFEKLI
jgi:hypothetical protein